MVPKPSAKASSHDESEQPDLDNLHTQLADLFKKACEHNPSLRDNPDDFVDSLIHGDTAGALLLTGVVDSVEDADLLASLGKNQVQKKQIKIKK